SRAIEQRVNRWFAGKNGSLTLEQLEKINDVLEKVQGGFLRSKGQLMAFRYEESPKSSGGGYIPAETIDKTIHLYWDYRRPGISPEEQMHILSHELTHLWADTDDKGYVKFNNINDRVIQYYD